MLSFSQPVAVTGDALHLCFPGIREDAEIWWSNSWCKTEPGKAGAPGERGWNLGRFCHPCLSHVVSPGSPLTASLRIPIPSPSGSTTLYFQWEQPFSGRKGRRAGGGGGLEFAMSELPRSHLRSESFFLSLLPELSSRETLFSLSGQVWKGTAG